MFCHTFPQESTRTSAAASPTTMAPLSMASPAGRWPRHFPLLHNTGFRTLGINALYQKWEVPPDKLPAFVESVRLLDIRGCSVTIPHKVGLLALLDEVSPLARQVGAANTIYWKGDRLCGENTDVAGFMAPLADMPLEGADVLLLGAGGAARAVAAGLASPHNAKRPARIFVATPSDKSHLPLAEEFGLAPLLWKDRHEPSALLVVNDHPWHARKAVKTIPFPIFRWRALSVAGAAKATPLACDIVCTTPSKPGFCARPALLAAAACRGLKCFLVRAMRSSASGQGRVCRPNHAAPLRPLLGNSPNNPT